MYFNLGCLHPRLPACLAACPMPAMLLLPAHSAATACPMPAMLLLPAHYDATACPVPAMLLLPD